MGDLIAKSLISIPNSTKMKNFKLTTLFILLTLPAFVLAQEESEPAISISGSADVYYKYDFSGNANIPTSFADEQNSLSIGMLDLVFEGSSGKASFVGEIAFGPRNAGSAGPAPSIIATQELDIPAYAPRIQNLYVSYAFSDVVSITGGYMGTFVGYEVISPASNFHYSTSYLFTNGPFQNAGIKLDIAASEKVGFMVGLFNPWNVYQSPADIGLSSLGAQLYVSPIDGWDAYLNFITGGESGTEFDLTTTFGVSEGVNLGLNAAYYTSDISADDASGFYGAAFYADFAVADNASLGARFENFNVDPGSPGVDNTSVSALTISGNIKGGNLTFIPEIRFDFSGDEIFLDSDNLAAKSASQIVFAAVYSF